MCSSDALSRLGITVGLLSLVTLVTAFVSNVWVFTREPVTLPHSHFTTSITFRIGFWRVCPSVKKINTTGRYPFQLLEDPFHYSDLGGARRAVGEEYEAADRVWEGWHAWSAGGVSWYNTLLVAHHMPSPACQLIRYSPWDELHGSDLGVLWAPLEFTPSFVSKMRFSMPFAAMSLVLSLVASLYALMGHCNTDHKTLAACGLYTLAGLALASGLVVFVSVLSDAYTDHPRHSQLQPFHYHYGWSFFTAGAAFVLAEVAALLSMTAYLQRFPSVEDMVRAMVPGADRRLQQRQLCKEFMVERTGSVLSPDMLYKADSLDPSEMEGCEGPLLTSQTPPDVCASNVPEDKTFPVVPITLMHKKPPLQGSSITFQFPTATFPRYATVVHQGVLGVSENTGTSSSSGSSASSAGVVTSSSGSCGSRTFQSLPRSRKVSTPSGFSDRRCGSPSSLSQGYCSGGPACQPIIIHSDEEIV